MANNKTFKGRISNKHDTSANWLTASNNGFTPLDGEIIIYDDLNRIKIGDGSTKVNELPFLNYSEEEIQDLIQAEITELKFNNPTQGAATGTSVAIINTINQNNGVISATGSTIQFNTALSDSNKAATMSDITTKINALDVSAKDLLPSQTVDVIKETNGKISVTIQDIAITHDQVTDFNDSVGGLIGELKWDGLDLAPNETIDIIKQENGIVNATKQDIAITSSQVTDFEDNVKKLFPSIVPTATDDGMIKLSATADGHNITITGSHDKVGTSKTSASNSGSVSGYGASKTISIPKISTDEWGHVASILDESVTITMPNVSDTKVTQTSKSDKDNVEYPLLAADSATPTSGSASSAIYNTKVTINPSTSTITATTFKGNLDGTADYADVANSASFLSNYNIGSLTQPVFFEDGIPIACTHSLNKTVPSNAVFTDTLVTQTVKSDDKNYPLLAAASAAPTSGSASTATYSTGITINPKTNTITANTFKGSLNGNADSADMADAVSGTLKIQANGTDKVSYNGSTSPTLNIATGSTNGTISIGGTDVSVKGLGSNAYTSTTIPSVTLNGSVTTSPSFYAPTTYGTSGQFLKTNGSGKAPTWASLATVATTGSYNDLTAKPTIPTSLSDFGVTASAAELNYVDGVTSNIQTQLNQKMGDFSIEIYNGTSGNPKPVRFASFNYSTCGSENGIAAKISMVSGHGNGSSYAFLQDAIIRVNHLGGVEVDNFKYYGTNAGTYDGATRQYGDIFWLVDETNKIVDFYCLMGQYSRVQSTPWKRLTYSTGGTVTQHTSCTVYSSGTKNWGNNSDIALLSDITKVTLNGTSSSAASFYAPTEPGTSGQVLKSNGSGKPTWTSLGSNAFSSTSYLPLAGGNMTGHINSTGNINLSNANSYFSLGITSGGSRCYFQIFNAVNKGADDDNLKAGFGFSWANSLTIDKSGNVNITGTATATKVYGAVWNDYAEYRAQEEEIKPGYCVVSGDNGKVSLTTEKFQACDGIVSDTFGFAIGETDECKTPLAVAGRVLAYAENPEELHSGDTVCAGPNGKVVKMTREEIREWPDRIVGIVSEIPTYETWGTGNVKVNGRIWIKVK